MRHRGQPAPPDPRGADRLYTLMGTSPPIQRLVQQVAQVARTDMTVLLHGETGTGKELVARCLHHCSPRAAGPFVAVDSGTIPESLAESELFGYVKGAFTGADGARADAFVQAQGGPCSWTRLPMCPR